MKRSKRFKKLKDIKQLETDQAAQKLGLAQSNLTNQKNRLIEMNQYKKEYIDQLSDASRSGISADHFQQYQLFLKQLDEMISQQIKAIATAEQQLKLTRSEWQVLHRRDQVYGKLVNQYHEQEQKLDAKKEQKQTDDFPNKKLE